jgi:adenylate cyclase
MGTEIERKFLVADPTVVEGRVGAAVRQGYLSRAKERTVRVRRADDRAWLTVKGANVGARRGEWEYEIPVADADELLRLCDGAVVEKTRYAIEAGGHTWEVDVFGGAHAGLVLAEVELDDEREAVELPAWLGAEVTGDPRYYNSNLG